MLIERPSGHRVYWEEMGDPNGPPLILILGLGIQISSWPAVFSQQLAEAGFRLIRMDNRDAGLSASETEAASVEVDAGYTLKEMGDDITAVLDDAGIEKAMLFGASLGGAIGQLALLDHPHRFAGGMFYMTTSGAPGLPMGKSEAIRAILEPEISKSEEEFIQHAISIRRRIGSQSVWCATDEELREIAQISYQRSQPPLAIARQSGAFIRQARWYERLGALKDTEIHVIHGEDDPVFPLACAEDLATRTGAELTAVPLLGHELNSKISNLIVYHLIQMKRRVFG